MLRFHIGKSVIVRLACVTKFLEYINLSNVIFFASGYELIEVLHCLIKIRACVASELIVIVC